MVCYGKRMWLTPNVMSQCVQQWTELTFPRRRRCSHGQLSRGNGEPGQPIGRRSFAAKCERNARVFRFYRNGSRKITFVDACRYLISQISPNTFI